MYKHTRNTPLHTALHHYTLHYTMHYTMHYTSPLLHIASIIHSRHYTLHFPTTTHCNNTITTNEHTAAYRWISMTISYCTEVVTVYCLSVLISASLSSWVLSRSLACVCLCVCVFAKSECTSVLSSLSVCVSACMYKNAYQIRESVW
jgi:hypothetical protein